MTGAGATPRRRTGAGLAVHKETHTLGETMGETSPASATTAAQPNDDDRDIAVELLEAIIADPLSAAELVVQRLAEVRVAAFTAGIESCEGAADDAHASGYAEGYDAGRCWSAGGQP